ncbi:MAG: LptF/LptG family permease [Phascolarctobacterium sp.]|nr:LptF/LptG family permease [Candidatus Phascolarctobacterium caballi]
MKLRILDRYVLKELLYPFVFGVASFSCIFIASTMLFRITKFVTQYGASIDSVARMFFYSLPEVINYTFPMSMLLAALMAFGKLSGSSEIVAMKASGISYYRIVAPILVVGFVISMFSVIWAEKVVPFAKTQCSYIIDYEIKHNTKPRGQNNVVIPALNGKTKRITYAKEFDEKQGKLYDVTISEYESGKIVRVQTSNEATYEEGVWHVGEGNIFSINDKDGVTSQVHFHEQVIPIDISPKQLSWERKDPEEMTIRELREYINILDSRDQGTYKQWCEIWMRINIPLASFFFAMIGAALGTQKQRTSSSIGLGISVIVIFIYYAIMTFTTGLAKGGVLNPFVACMLPNLLCLIVGIYLMKRKNA